MSLAAKFFFNFILNLFVFNYVICWKKYSSRCRREFHIFWLKWKVKEILWRQKKCNKSSPRLLENGSIMEEKYLNHFRGIELRLQIQYLRQSSKAAIKILQLLCRFLSHLIQFLIALNCVFINNFRTTCVYHIYFKYNMIYGLWVFFIKTVLSGRK